MAYWGLFFEDNTIIYKQLAEEGNVEFSVNCMHFSISYEDPAHIVLNKGTESQTIGEVLKFVVPESSPIALLSVATNSYEFMRLLDYTLDKYDVTVERENVPMTTHMDKYLHLFCFESEVKVIRYLHPEHTQVGRLNPRNSEWKGSVRKLFGLSEKANIGGFFREQTFLALLPKDTFSLVERVMMKISQGKIIWKEKREVKGNFFRHCLGKPHALLNPLFEQLLDRTMSFQEFEEKLRESKESQEDVEELRKCQDDIRRLTEENLQLRGEIEDLQTQLKTAREKQAMDNERTVLEEETLNPPFRPDCRTRRESETLNSSFSTDYGASGESERVTGLDYDSEASLDLFVSPTPTKRGNMERMTELDYESEASLDLFASPTPTKRRNMTSDFSAMEKNLEEEVLQLKKDLEEPNTSKRQLEDVPEKNSKKEIVEQKYVNGEVVEAEEKGIWYKAKVIEIDAGNVTVHWHGYSKQYDCKVAMNQLRKVEVEEFYIGDEVEAYEKKFNMWYRGEVVGITKNGYKVHFPLYAETKVIRESNLKKISSIP